MRRSLASLASLVPLVALVALAACSSTPAPTSGRVVALRYDPPQDWTEQVCASYGKYGCNVYVPIENHEDASWHLLIDGRDDKGTARRGWRTVDAETYARCAVDNSYTAHDGCHRSER